MNKRNKVKHLQRSHSHKKAMLSNMVTSLFFHEQIKTTVAKAKVARSLAEKLITKAKKSISKDSDSLSDKEKKAFAGENVYLYREVAKVIHDKEVLDKLFNNIAPRYLERAGGYTRVVKIGKRVSDASEMAVLELVDRKSLVELKEERKEIREKRKEKQKEKKSE